jgi:hypothetical protein
LEKERKLNQKLNEEIEKKRKEKLEKQFKEKENRLLKDQFELFLLLFYIINQKRKR